MFEKRGTGRGLLNSLAICEGSFKWNQMDGGQPTTELSAVYVDKDSSVTLGKCPVRESLLSEETRAKLLDFILSAEKDFGRMVFERGVALDAEELRATPAETMEGFKGLGE